MEMNEGVLTEQQRKCVPDVTFELIPIKNLVSNQEYQRPLSEGHIRKTLEEFDIYQINPVKVSRRGGINYVFDGQHTIEIVASESGSRDTPVWCMIYDDLAYIEEAHVFADQQRHVKSLAPYETFHAHIEAGDSKQKLIEATVESYGLPIGKKMSPNCIRAVSTLEKIFDKYGEKTLDRTIRLVVATWEGEGDSFSGSVLLGVARILDAYGDSLKDEIFKEHVGKVSVKWVMRTAKERHPGSLGYAEAMMVAYNQKNRYRLSMKKLHGGKRQSANEELVKDEAGKA